eukprot:gene17612-biopygen12382
MGSCSGSASFLQRLGASFFSGLVTVHGLHEPPQGGVRPPRVRRARRLGPAGGEREDQHPHPVHHRVLLAGQPRAELDQNNAALLEQMAEMAAALGRDADAARYGDDSRKEAGRSPGIGENLLLSCQRDLFPDLRIPGTGSIPDRKSR